MRSVGNMSSRVGERFFGQFPKMLIRVLPQFQCILLFLLLCTAARYAELQSNNGQEDYQPIEPQPEHIDGRSFFFLGTLFRRWRDRWIAFHNPAPLFAGPAYPINGYYNCPSYGCNPAAIAPQPGFYSPAYYAASMPQQPPQQQQAAQGNSNVYIYQADQNNAAGTAGMSPPAYGPGYFGPARQPLPQGPPFPMPPASSSPSFPLPALSPTAPVLPPASSPPQASASSFGFASGPLLPASGCGGPNLMSCGLG